MDKTIKVLIATHKIYEMPDRHEVYLPIHVGAQGKEPIGYQGDNTGDNISHLNPYYCELTGLYWAWKNLECDYLGLAHYRRHFTNQTVKFRDGIDVNDVVLTQNQMQQALMQADVIVPKKRYYYIETLYSHYAHTFDRMHLDVTRDIIAEFTPEYLGAFDATMKQRSAYMFNMYIMTKEKSDAYCQWLFTIVDELFKRIDRTHMTDFQARYVGRISELLFNVWLNHHQYAVIEKPFLMFGKANWLLKGWSFLKSKFFGVPYTKSF
ncbi:DUF4422 domain-containing protein [Carnobacteriaceae bacterium zg-ZUI240]|nr:DUF4422 domain-containing protein [Carnobacteriaceae bacterium zg-ZUI240]